MTKAELAKKKGIALKKEALNPSESLITTRPADEKENKAADSPKKSSKSSAQTKDTQKSNKLNDNSTSTKANPKRDNGSKTEKPMAKPNITTLSKESVIVAPVQTEENMQPAIPAEESQKKRGPGKPKKRKDGDKKISFWLDEDLVNGLYSHLSYGESAGEKINDAIREYQKKHGLYEA